MGSVQIGLNLEVMWPPSLTYLHLPDFQAKTVTIDLEREKLNMQFYWTKKFGNSTSYV